MNRNICVPTGLAFMLVLSAQAQGKAPEDQGDVRQLHCVVTKAQHFASTPGRPETELAEEAVRACSGVGGEKPRRVALQQMRRLALYTIGQGRASTRPVPRGELAGLFSPADYPAAARAAAASGDVTLNLTVGPNGRVTGCSVTRSSGSATLDSASCRIIRSRARFTPAVSINGAPAAAQIVYTHRWTLPE
jgi:TonB family protein